MKHILWPAVLLIGLLLVALPAAAQTPAPPAAATVPGATSTSVPSPTATPLPSPTLTPPPTQPPAILLIQPTPAPTPVPQGGWLEQTWQTHKTEIVLALVLAILSGIVVGVWLKRIAEALQSGLEGLFHFLFDRFASAPLLRLRYEKIYRQTLAASVQDLPGGNLVDRSIKLEKVYVPVGLTREALAARQADCEDRYQWDADRRRKQRLNAVTPRAAVTSAARLVVLGGPGAGKTTYLAHLAFLCARRQLLPAYTPVFARLRDLLDAPRLEDALPAIIAKHNFPNAGRFIERQLQAGRCLLLLDGLDEVANQAQHQRLVDLVQDFANRCTDSQAADCARGNILVLSCRTYSYQHGKQLTGFDRLEVMEFEDAEIEQFAHNWFDAPALQPLAGEVTAALQQNPRLLELARNPLLLLLILHHYQQERNLPRLRSEMYKHCIRTRITRWNTQRGTHQGRFGETDKWRLLRELALDWYRREWPAFVEAERLLEWIEAFAAKLRLPEGAAAADLFDEVARTSGLIQEMALDRYGFSHRTLQEYFAAEGIDRLGADAAAGLLEARLEQPAWREIILLYAGLADDAGLLLRRMAARAEAGGGGLWLLAGRCLEEGARNVPAPAVRSVSAGLFDRLRAIPGLSQEDEAGAVDVLKTYAVEALPGYVDILLESGATPDLLLASRLGERLPAEDERRARIRRGLAQMAQRGDADERRAATTALGWMGENGAAETLLAGLGDPDAAARAAAARALGRLGKAGKAAAAALLRLHEADPEDAPRHAALEALLALGRPADLGLILVPAGEFLMGSGGDDRQAEDKEKPQHTIYLTDYYIERAPVTNAAYRRFVQAGGYANPAYWAEAIAAGRWKEGQYIDYNDKLWGQPRLWDDKKWNGDLYPVVGVSWYEALAYARWAGRRLPTEAEWEKAASWEPNPPSPFPTREGGARGIGRKRIYPWGDEFDAARCNSEESGLQRTTPVGQYSPQGDSPLGCSDMAGNVWEWCSTAYKKYPYEANDGREDLGGGDNVSRVLRGGSWYNNHTRARCADRRDDDYPGVRLNYWGFRCCCSTFSLSSGSGS
jgi:formylglycine-generating enzyme required for sulfatase activity